MLCLSCGGECRDGVRECGDCRVPLVLELPQDVTRKRIPILPTISKTLKRPFLLAFLGVMFFLVGGLETFGSLASLIKMFADALLGLQVREALLDGISGLASVSVARAIWKENTCGRPGVVVFALSPCLIEASLKSTEIESPSDVLRSISLQETLTALVFTCLYLYM
jgi:hypothetical protein